MKRAFLTVLGADGVPACVKPIEHESITIGRDAACDIVLAATGVSRTHARIDFENGVYTISDLGSTLGVSVNGSRVTHAALHPGDIIGLDTLRLRFECGDEAMQEEVPEPPNSEPPQVSAEEEQDAARKARRSAIWIEKTKGFFAWFESLSEETRAAVIVFLLAVLVAMPVLVYYWITEAFWGTVFVNTLVVCSLFRRHIFRGGRKVFARYDKLPEGWRATLLVFLLGVLVVGVLLTHLFLTDYVWAIVASYVLVVTAFAHWCLSRRQAGPRAVQPEAREGANTSEMPTASDPERILAPPPLPAAATGPAVPPAEAEMPPYSPWIAAPATRGGYINDVTGEPISAENVEHRGGQARANPRRVLTAPPGDSVARGRWRRQRKSSAPAAPSKWGWRIVLVVVVVLGGMGTRIAYERGWLNAEAPRHPPMAQADRGVAERGGRLTNLPVSPSAESPSRPNEPSAVALAATRWLDAEIEASRDLEECIIALGQIRYAASSTEFQSAIAQLQRAEARYVTSGTQSEDALLRLRAVLPESLRPTVFDSPEAVAAAKAKEALVQTIEIANRTNLQSWERDSIVDKARRPYHTAQLAWARSAVDVVRNGSK
ncbi:MAG: FHA domain-containing protein [Planctomycetes bacterium]|nr:FHA domain-containing protein [Planctomycetota bacterium]